MRNSKENFDPNYNGAMGYFTLFWVLFLLKPLRKWSKTVEERRGNTLKLDRSASGQYWTRLEQIALR